MDLIIQSKKYTIKNDIWEKHVLMHPVRPKEALMSNIKVVFYKKEYTSTDIEQMILDEYSVHNNITNILIKAREKYNE